MSLKSIFFPENKKFFVLFDELAASLVAMSKLFLSVSVAENDRLTLTVKEAEEAEQKNEVLTHKLFIELGRNFITPFDREDIHLLAKGLNSIASRHLALIRQLRAYKLTQSSGLTRTVAEESHRATEMLAQILHSLRNAKALIGLSGTCADIKRILYDCDNLTDRAVSALMEQQSNTVDVIKKMDHYEALQRLLETYGDTLNVIESIIIKYG